MREQQRVDETRRVEIREVRGGEPAERGFERARIARELEREAIGATLGPAREGGGQRQRHELQQSPDEQQDRNPARRRVERPHEEHSEREARHHEQRPLRDVAVAPVPELVRDDDLDLRPFRVGDQRVVEDDAPGAAEPGDVGVVLARATARVGDEDLAHRNAGAPRQREQAVGEVAALERRELVEQRLEHERRDEHEQQRDQSGPARGDERPPRREHVDRPEQRDHRHGGEHRADRKPLGAIARPAAPGLRREAPAALAHEAAPERKRQPHDLENGQHEHREQDGAGPPRAARQRIQPVAEPTERQQRRHKSRQRDVCGQSEVERPVIRPGPGHLVGSEENRRIQGIRTSRLVTPSRLHP